MSDEQRRSLQVDLRDDLACRICLKDVEDARFLPCHHFYCKNCIVELASKSDKKGAFACPECRTDIRLTDEEIEQLPVAHIVAKLQRVRTKANVKHSNKDADAGAGSSSQSAGGNLTCPTHNLQLKLLCADCMQLVCAECAVGDHKSHSCDYVRDATVPRFADLLSKEAESLSVIQSASESAVANVDRTRREITEQSNAITSKLNNAFDDMVKILEQKREDLLQDLASIVHQKLASLSEQDRALRDTLRRIAALTESLSQPIQSRDTATSMRKDLVPKIKKEIEGHSTVSLQPCETANIEADINTINDLKGLCTSSMSLYFRQDSGEGRLERVELNQPACFKLSALPASTPKSTVNVTLVSLVDGSSVPVTIVAKEQHYEAQYTPTTRGHHDMAVEVNGKPLRGSPFPLFVTVSPSQLRNPVRVIKGFNRPNGIAFNSKGEMVLSEAPPASQVSIRDKYGKRLITLKGWKINNPHGVAIDSEDNIYISEYSNNRVAKFDPEGNYLKSIGNKGSEPGKFNFPRSIMVFRDRLYVCDGANNRVQVFDRQLQYLDALSDARMSKGTMSIAASDRDDLLFVSGTGVPGGIQVFKTDHSFVTSIQFACPSALCFSAEQNLLFVADSNQRCVSVFRPDGQLITKLCQGENNEGQLEYSYGIAIDQDGFVYVTDYGNGQILVY